MRHNGGPAVRLAVGSRWKHLDLTAPLRHDTPNLYSIPLSYNNYKVLWKLVCFSGVTASATQIVMMATHWLELECNLNECPFVLFCIL